MDESGAPSGRRSRRPGVKREKRLLQYHRIRPPRGLTTTNRSRNSQSELAPQVNTIANLTCLPSLSSAKRPIAFPRVGCDYPSLFRCSQSARIILFIMATTVLTILSPVDAKSTLMTSSAFSPFRFHVVAKKGQAFNPESPSAASGTANTSPTGSALARIKKRLERDEDELARLSASIASSAQSELLSRPKKKRDYVTLQCGGMYDQGIFTQLNRICEDCYNLYKDAEVHEYCRADCFSTSTFRQCLQSLLLDKESDFYLELVEIIGKKKKR